MTEATVARRLVFALTGYEPLEADHQHRRFARELKRFETTWSVDAEAGPAETAGPVTRWRVTTAAPNWRTETQVVNLTWDDIVAADFARSEPSRLVDGLTALADFIVSGTLFRYFRTNWRYALFFLYPLVMLIAFVAFGVMAARAVVGFGLMFNWMFAAVVLVAAPVVTWQLARDRLYLAYILDDWHFARDLVRGNRQDLDRRIDAFADTVVRTVRESDADEVVFVGYSLGAALILLVLERAMARDPELVRRRPQVALVTIGSSILKVGLHPAAVHIRKAATAVAREPAIAWVEYQALVDIINFYKCNPAVEMRLDVPSPPLVRIVKISRMLERETYRRFRLDFFRMHRQFVMGNERRYFYDYFMLLCGPLPVRRWLAEPDRSVAGFAHDGAYAPAPVEAPL